MSAKKALIFSDLDGTLLDHYSYQSTAAQPTLKQLHDANIPVILNTSKTLAELDIIRTELNLETPFTSRLILLSRNQQTPKLSVIIS